MLIKIKLSWLLLLLVFGFSNCKDDDTIVDDVLVKSEYAAMREKFKGVIDFDKLENYAHQTTPSYITKDNSMANPVTDKGATLGRILFYDKQLSLDNTISCGSCHKQSLAFSDLETASKGVAGTTGRHSMRLVNTRFSAESKFFWNERATSLEAQTTQPIQDHIEMGYSGKDGNPDFSVLLTKLAAVPYYQDLFHWVYGSSEINESKIQQALGQFIRSIQSFDSKYDAGRVNANSDAANFSNFTAAENNGKTLFIQRPTFDNTGTRTAGGAGCAGCHTPPEFDIDPNSRNNGIIAAIGGGTDLTNTRSPSLRDVVNGAGAANGLFMHNGSFGALQGVLAHYNEIPANNANLDPRLKPQNNLQKLNLTMAERGQLVQFLNTLTGSNLYTDSKWSSPF